MTNIDLERPSGPERMDGLGVVQCPAGHDRRETAISRYDGFKPIYRCRRCGMEWHYELMTRTVVLLNGSMVERQA